MATERIGRIGAFAALMALLLFVAGSAFALSTPQRTGWVTDAAHVLDADSLSVLATRLEELQRRTGDEVVVVTLPDLQGTTIETWGNLLGDTWRIGKMNGREDGVVLVVAPNDRRVRIAVGHGLAERIPDSVAAAIISDHIIPYFRAGQMAEGIRAGIDSIALQLIGAAPTANGTPMVYTHPRMSFWTWLVQTYGPSRHTLQISFWVLVGIVVFIVMAINAPNVGSGRGRRGWYNDDYYDSGWYSGGSSWGGGGGSSGGSSGGGGGSFGGGASGSW
jgi:uncharacterized protein